MEGNLNTLISSHIFNFPAFVWLFLKISWGAAVMVGYFSKRELV
jgi:hypothetical protein